MELRELAQKLGGRGVEGDATLRIEGVSSLEAGGPGHIGFVRTDAFADALARSGVGAVIAPEGMPISDRPVLRSKNPSLDFARTCALLHPAAPAPPGVHPRAHIEPGATVDATASVGPLAVVGAGSRIGARTLIGAGVVVGENVEIGPDCILHAGALVREGIRIGARVILQPGCIIGGDGFGYEPDEQGRFEKVPQIGTVVLEDDVEIGAGTTVDRARIGETRIARGVKVDNLVQIAHNVEVGEDSVVLAQSGVAGSARLGRRVMLMAQSGVGGHVRLGDGVFVGARGGVISNVKAAARLFGFPAREARAWRRSQALLMRLGDLFLRVRRLEKRAGIRPGDEAR